MTLWDFLDLSPLQSWFNFWFLIIFVLPGDRDWDDSEATRGEGIVSSLGIITADKLPIIKYLQLQIARERSQIRFFWNRSQLEEAEQRQRELQTTRLALEKEITVKKNSISIDRLSSSRWLLVTWTKSKSQPNRFFCQNQNQPNRCLKIIFLPGIVAWGSEAVSPPRTICPAIAPLRLGSNRPKIWEIQRWTINHGH